MKKLIALWLLIVPIALLTSCEKDEQGYQGEILGLGGEDIIENDIDRFIYENFTKPYNMEVKYRWDQSELDLNRTLVPIQEERVIPILETILRVWIRPYEQIVGVNFIKKLSPKKFILVGSPKYNNNKITLGEAEGGRKIVMYRLNWFTLDNVDIIREIMKTVHHEFGHTMHQTVLYPLSFKLITPGAYNSAWNNVTDDAALRTGFVSPYASAMPDEDFVDTLARILVYGRKWFDARVAKAAAIYADPAQNAGLTYNPAEALRSKEAIIIKYLYDAWKVDLYDQPGDPKRIGLETLVQQAILDVAAKN